MKTKQRIKLGQKFKLTQDFTGFVKEGHEVGGHSRATTISAGNSITVVGKRPHNWFEAQVSLTERYEPPYGGATIRWRGVILVHADQIDKFE
jgi:hypothetical protein